MADAESTNDVASSHGDQRRIDGPIAISMLFVSAAGALAIVAYATVFATYSRHGSANLDMPDWFSINLVLAMVVLPLAGLGAIFLLISAIAAFDWFKTASPAVRAAFILQWLVSAALVGSLLFSWLPIA